MGRFTTRVVLLSLLCLNVLVVNVGGWFGGRIGKGGWFRGRIGKGGRFGRRGIIGGRIGKGGGIGGSGGFGKADGMGGGIGKGTGGGSAGDHGTGGAAKGAKPLQVNPFGMLGEKKSFDATQRVCKASSSEQGNEIARP
ncbi:hypothetical protein COLO4_38584 [Corchorus olitorius]|uniref:Uncharacterized protein n=1 Tax=Corchorus olitorius TaxID=93759 RepID=A0A1R3FU19_9ROSI|nr:hypothetical protein COLO4_38584 [Corchorus olitorius]